MRERTSARAAGAEWRVRRGLLKSVCARWKEFGLEAKPSGDARPCRNRSPGTLFVLDRK